MIADSDLERFWNPDNMVKWPAHIVATLQLPEDSKEFLNQVGLPRGLPDHVRRFVQKRDWPEDVFWPMRFGLDATKVTRLESHPKCIIIGYDYDVPFCLDEEHQGCVLSPDCDGSMRYVNRDVRAFVQCLTLYLGHKQTPVPSLAGAIARAIDDVEQSMRSVDLSAFDHPESWWRVIIEQMRDGLL